MVKVMKKRSILIVTGLAVASAIPFSLNILLNIYFENLDTELYEKKKARVEQRRQIEQMFPDLNTQDPLRSKLALEADEGEGVKGP